MYFAKRATVNIRTSSSSRLFSCLQTELTSPTDSEDRTPGRLQAVWPPPKPKDEEEKVGLKYTEAGESTEKTVAII